MDLYGIDIDGVLLPLRKHDNLSPIRAKVRALASEGHRIEILTSRSDVDGARAKLRHLGISFPIHRFSRDIPAGKGQWLVDAMARDPRFERCHLWDDEAWYLNPAHRLGVSTWLVKDGRITEHRCSLDYVPWVPKSRPAESSDNE